MHTFCRGEPGRHLGKWQMELALALRLQPLCQSRERYFSRQRQALLKPLSELPHQMDLLWLRQAQRVGRIQAQQTFHSYIQSERMGCIARGARFILDTPSIYWAPSLVGNALNAIGWEDNL